MKLVKHGFRFELPEEFRYDWASDRRFLRRVEDEYEEPVSDAEWAEYRKAKKAWKVLRNSPHFRGGELVKPQPRLITHYAETAEERLARCRMLWAEGVR